MKFTSTRANTEHDSLPCILRGLAPDGGLFVPRTIPAVDLGACTDLAGAERAALGAFFDDVPESVRADAIRNLLAKFPAHDPIPLVEADGFRILELFHGPTGAFKDVALSVLPVLMVAAANGRRVLILTATSGDTGSAAMAGFADVPGVEIAVFFPNTGTSRIQRLQMTTPSAKNVHGIAIRGNFDDAQAAVKRIFSDAAIRAQAERAGVTLSSANSINIGRLVPQIGYYLLAAARIGRTFDVVVPSGNFGNILAASYAKAMGAPIRRFVCASNVNDVLTRFINTGTYDPGEKFTVTNSPSMDIRRSSNVERLLWLVNGGLEDGGIDLISAGGGAYRVQLEDDARDLYEVGTVTLPVGQDCVLTDDADPEDPGRTLYAGDLLGLGDEVFSPQATTVETAGGMVTAIHRDYMP